VAEKDNAIVKSVKELSSGDILTLVMNDGSAITEVVKIKGENHI
jgi:exonuclease VII large subunit